MFPKSSDSPFAALDCAENLVTDYNGILDVMKSEYVFRSRNREIDPKNQDLRELKEYLCMIRLRISKLSKYTPWVRTDLDDTIARLKLKRCRDPEGHINELYKSMGEDDLSSLLDLLNRIKNCCCCSLYLRALLHSAHVKTITL